MDIWISPIFQVLSPIAKWRFSIAKAVQNSPNWRHIAKSGNPAVNSKTRHYLMQIQPVQSEYNAFIAGRLAQCKGLEKQLGYGNKHYYGCYGNQCQQISTRVWNDWISPLDS